MTNQYNGTLYTGVTSNLIKRIYEHRNKLLPGFTSKYDCQLLVYYEVYENIVSAIEREKQIKLYKRSKKLELINNKNPEWKDLYLSLVSGS